MIWALECTACPSDEDDRRVTRWQHDVHCSQSSKLVRKPWQGMVAIRTEPASAAIRDSDRKSGSS